MCSSDTCTFNENEFKHAPKEVEIFFLNSTTSPSSFTLNFSFHFPLKEIIDKIITRKVNF